MLDVGIIHQSLIACQDLGNAKGYPRRIRLGCPAGLARSSFPMSLAGVTLRVTDFHFDSKNASRGPYFPTDDTLFRILCRRVAIDYWHKITRLDTNVGKKKRNREVCLLPRRLERRALD